MSASRFPTRLIPPYSLLQPDQTGAGIVLLCDHASALIPPDMADLGLPPDLRRTHIVWDIGAAKVTRCMALHLRCPAILSGVSRLVVDCNRFPHDPSAMPSLSGGSTIPGNQHITPAQRQDRLDHWFHPYHQAIQAMLVAMSCPLVVSIHSFTPQMADQPPRPWHIGVLWNRDTRLSDPVIAKLESSGHYVVGRNQPYSGQEINYTLDRHAGTAGLAHVSLEIRQDLLTDEYQCAGWGERLARLLGPLAQQTDLRTPLPPSQRLVLD